MKTKSQLYKDWHMFASQECAFLDKYKNGKYDKPMFNWWLSKLKEIIDEIVGEDKSRSLNCYQGSCEDGYNEAKAEIKDRITKLGL